PDPDHHHEINATVINEALRHKPADMAVTLHMCRGNYRSAWFSSGGYDFVAEDVFGRLKVDGLFVGDDDERSGTLVPTADTSGTACPVRSPPLNRIVYTVPVPEAV